MKMSVKRSMDEIIHILKQLRVGIITDEYTLQTQTADTLLINSASFIKEHRLGRGSRVDFLTYSAIAIEVKKGRLSKASVHTQLRRYAEHDEIKSIILVVEKQALQFREKWLVSRVTPYRTSSQVVATEHMKRVVD